MSDPPDSTADRPRRLQTLFDTVPDAIVLHDDRGHILDCNRRAVEQLGYPRSDLLSMTIFEIEDGIDPATVESLWESLGVGDQTTAEGLHRRDDGSTYPAEISIRKIRLDGRERYVTLSRDISDRKARERELERYKTFIENSSDVIAVLDRIGTFRYVSPAIEEIRGYEPDDLIGRPIAEFLDPEVADEILAEWAEFIESPGSTKTIETRFLDHDGDYAWIEVRARNMLEDPAIEGILINSSDISDRKEQRRELERHRRYLENTTDVITVHDADGMTTYVSPAIKRALGYAPDTLLDVSIFEYVHPDDRDILRRAHEAIKTEPAAEGEAEYRIQDAEGEYRWFASTARNLLDDPDIEGIISTSRDVTNRKRRERDLERTRALLSDTERMANVGAYEVNLETEESWWTDGMRQVFDVDEDFEPTLENSIDQYHPDDRDRVATAFQTLIEEGKSSVLEARIDTEDGRERWVQGFGKTIDIDGVAHIRGYVMDITERKAHEQQLAALHAATRDVIEAESRERVLEIALEAASELLGFALTAIWEPSADSDCLELAANTPDHDRLLDGADVTDPILPAEHWAWEVYETGATAVKSPIAREELAMDVPLQSAIIVSLGPHGVISCSSRGVVEFSDRQIRVAEILARNVRVALDQLDQRTALERQQQFTDDLIDAIEDIIYVLDSDGNLLEWNSAMESVTGYSATELETMNALDFFDERHRDAAEAAVGEAFETGRTRLELELVTAEGNSIPYEFIANSFHDPAGRPVAAGIGRDRTTHVEYQRTLEEQRDGLKLLNEVMRHDIRNDLTAIRGYADLLADSVDDEGVDHLAVVKGNTEHAIELTKTARDLATVMLESAPERRSIALTPVVEAQVKEIRSTFPTAEVTIASPIPSQPVAADSMLEAVVRNLLQNAIQHNDREEPHVRIEFERPDDDAVVRLMVADNGPGVPDSLKERIFERGEKRLDSEGTGLGLYLVKTLIDRYHGDVWVEDNDPRGAVFVVELPVANAT